MKTQDFIFKNINKLDITDKEHITRILILRDINIKQTNNGVYFKIADLDEITINDVVEIIRNKLI